MVPEPVPKGFDQHEVIAIINQIIKSRKVICFEVVEVNPLLDTKGNKMAETAFEVLEQITSTLFCHLNSIIYIIIKSQNLIIILGF
jgi:arginase